MKKIYQEIKNIPPTDRVKYLREFYLTNAPMSVNRDIACWKCHRSQMLYVQGWEKAIYAAPTVKIRRAMAEAYLAENTKPIIIKGELLTGQPNLTDLTDEEKSIIDNQTGENICLPMKWGRADHLAMDYQLLLDKGVIGIIDLLDKKIAELDVNDGSQVEKYEFYTCCKIELEGFKTLCESYAKEVYRLYTEADGNDKEDYKKLYDVVSTVPLNPAKTFHQALQAIHMYTWSLYGIYSYGKPDTYLLPYYRHDIEEGIITRSDAQELIDCFFLLNIANMSAWAAQGCMLSGRDENGNIVENELTWHFLRAIEHTHIPDPNIGFCVTNHTSSDILEYVSSIIKQGHAQPQIWNADAVTESMLNYGFDNKAANMFTLSTCVETTPIGRSGVSITSPYINLLKVFINAFNKCDNNSSFEDIFIAFEKEVDSFFKSEILKENLYQLDRYRNLVDPSRVSVLVHSCIESGLSHECGGADYNQLEPNILGMQNVSESFNVIYDIVFEKKLITVTDFKKILADNYKGHEDILSIIKTKVKHFGTGDKTSNEIAKRVADTIINTCKKFTTIRGAAVIPGAFSYREHEIQGRTTPATPDGRLAGMPLNDGSCPVQGYDNLGPTLSLASTNAWEPTRFLGGISVNVKINKDVKAEKIKALIEGFLKLKVSQIQFNIVDTNTLLDAQKNPDMYANLLVRVGGYSDFFVKLPKSLQNEIISRTTNECL